jgi:hypothetical protein
MPSAAEKSAAMLSGRPRRRARARPDHPSRARPLIGSPFRRSGGRPRPRPKRRQRRASVGAASSAVHSPPFVKESAPCACTGEASWRPTKTFAACAVLLAVVHRACRRRVSRQKPSLVVVISVDQMRADYLDGFSPTSARTGSTGFSNAEPFSRAHLRHSYAGDRAQPTPPRSGPASIRGTTACFQTAGSIPPPEKTPTTPRIRS